MPSARRVTFSGEHLPLVQIAQYYSDIEASVRNYFSFENQRLGERFVGYTPLEIELEMTSVLAEHARSTSMSILAALEATFRMDFLQRCYKRRRDPLSRYFRELHKQRGQYVPLKDIFSQWQLHSNVPRSIISDLDRAFKYRHWLAHGRYWTPKIGREYDYDDIYALAESIYNSFPFEE
ncbi:MAG: hypothetical protein F4Z57_02090 [Gemmatimonadetes bacterium]|nr:hypothetical protein [Gemmatimonadota bacterium]MYC72723.1 hypothetical protein [Gemmatimonadota bacterium]MYI62796.1 hypothetical protein [Gemmatimonadota bacterium]